MSVKLQHIINRDATNLLFLCGAGISYNAPTNLPTVNKFVFEALKECGANAEVTMAVEKKTPYG